MLRGRNSGSQAASAIPRVCLLDEHKQKLDLPVEITHLSMGGALVSYRRSPSVRQLFRARQLHPRLGMSAACPEQHYTGVRYLQAAALPST